VRTAHSASAIFLALAFAGAQPSPQEPVLARAMQYHSADAVLGINETALSARRDTMIARMELPPLSEKSQVKIYMTERRVQRFLRTIS
jgi:hypothetical protein